MISVGALFGLALTAAGSTPLRMANARPFHAATARSLGLTPAQVEATVQLLKSDATVPFIVRYRADVTNGLDEPQVVAVRAALQKHEALEERRAAILKLLGKHDPPPSAEVVAAVRQLRTSLPWKTSPRHTVVQVAARWQRQPGRPATACSPTRWSSRFRMALSIACCPSNAAAPTQPQWACSTFWQRR